MMDQHRIREASLLLQKVLAKYTPADPEARNLHTCVEGLVQKGLAGQITTPLEWREIPGDYWFTEGSLRQYPDLESAFAKFRLEITGGLTPNRQKIMKLVDQASAKTAVS